MVEIPRFENDFEKLLAAVYPQRGESVIRPCEMMVTIGHSVAMHRGEALLSRDVQPVIERGQRKDGSKIYFRTAEKLEETRKEDLYNFDHAIVGGGELVGKAVQGYYEKLKEQDRQPSLLVNCGGRPGYLETFAKDKPGVTEASVMKEYLAGKLGEDVVQINKEGTKNTNDDIAAAIEEAKRQGVGEVVLIALGLRIPRCIAAMKQVVETHPEWAEINVRFVPAESILREQAYTNSFEYGKEWDEYWETFTHSKAYIRTMEDEKGGFESMNKGTYAGKGNQ